MAEIIVALDVSSEDEALHLIDRLPDLRWAKIGPMLFLKAGTAVITALKDRGVKVFLDLKWYDIPHAVSGAVETARELGADLATVHALGGSEMLRAAAGAGAAGFSVVNTLPGFLYQGNHGRRHATARLGAGNGGVSGPALLPVGVLATRRVCERTGLPVVGIGGIRLVEDVEQYLEAGAVLVGVGTAAMADPRCPERLAAAWMNRG